MERMPCGLEDDRVRYEPEEEEDDPRTDLEKRLSWICDEWNGALEIDRFEDWHDIRMMLHGASQSLIQCKDRFEDQAAMRVLGTIAFQNSIDCIRAGKYEGAPK